MLAIPSHLFPLLSSFPITPPRPRTQPCLPPCTQDSFSHRAKIHCTPRLDAEAGDWGGATGGRKAGDRERRKDTVSAGVRQDNDIVVAAILQDWESVLPLQTADVLDGQARLRGCEHVFKGARAGRRKKGAA